jgi:hypothetical protein
LIVILFSETLSEHQFFHNFQETLFEIAKHTMPNPPPFDRFGFFLTKNASREADLPLYTMYTGEGDPYKLSTIAAVDGSTNLGRNPLLRGESNESLVFLFRNGLMRARQKY